MFVDNRNATQYKEGVSGDHHPAASEPTMTYLPCAAEVVPASIRFDVPGHLAGQTVEVAYGTRGRAEAGYGDPYKRVVDRSDGSVKYFVRAKK